MNKFLVPIAQFLAGFALLLGGVALGVWFGQHYQIVPRDAATTTPTEVAKAPSPPVLPPILSSKKEPSKTPFKAGSQRNYRLEAAITGSGVEQKADPMDVAMDFSSNFKLGVNAVDTQGIADLELVFGDTSLQGEFMGSPVSFAKTADGLNYKMDGMGPSDAASPQMAFFNTPIRMRVTPDGQVVSAQGMEGFEKVLAPVSSLARPQLTGGDVNSETQWTSDFVFPIPGLPQSPAAQAVNKVLGYEEVDGRKCVAVSQEIRSDTSSNPLGGAAGFIGQFAGLTMPKFKLEGHNLLYYEADTGELYRADLNLKLGLEIGQSMKGAAQMLGVVGNLLKEMEGADTPKDNPTDASPSMNLGVAITGNLALVPETQVTVPVQP